MWANICLFHSNLKGKEIHSIWVWNGVMLKLLQLPSILSRELAYDPFGLLFISLIVYHLTPHCPFWLDDIYFRIAGKEWILKVMSLMWHLWRKQILDLTMIGVNHFLIYRGYLCFIFTSMKECTKEYQSRFAFTFLLFELHSTTSIIVLIVLHSNFPYVGYLLVK